MADPAVKALQRQLRDLQDVLANMEACQLPVPLLPQPAGSPVLTFDCFGRPFTGAHLRLLRQAVHRCSPSKR